MPLDVFELPEDFEIPEDLDVAEDVGDVTPELRGTSSRGGDEVPKSTWVVELLVRLESVLPGIWACAAPTVSVPVRTRPATVKAAKCLRDVDRRAAREVRAEFFITADCRSE